MRIINLLCVQAIASNHALCLFLTTAVAAAEAVVLVLTGVVCGSGVAVQQAEELGVADAAAHILTCARSHPFYRH
jgi:hypothetical protein